MPPLKQYVWVCVFPIHISILWVITLGHFLKDIVSKDIHSLVHTSLQKYSMEVCGSEEDMVMEEEGEGGATAAAVVGVDGGREPVEGLGVSGYEEEVPIYRSPHQHQVCLKIIACMWT